MIFLAIFEWKKAESSALKSAVSHQNVEVMNFQFFTSLISKKSPTDCFLFLAENVLRRMKNFFSQLILERLHYDAKFIADEENWHFQTRITLAGHIYQTLIVSSRVALTICFWSKKFFLDFEENVVQMDNESKRCRNKNTWICASFCPLA